MHYVIREDFDPPCPKSNFTVRLTQTDRHRQTDRQTGRQAERQTNRQKQPFNRLKSKMVHQASRAHVYPSILQTTRASWMSH